VRPLGLVRPGAPPTLSGARRPDSTPLSGPYRPLRRVGVRLQLGLEPDRWYLSMATDPLIGTAARLRYFYMPIPPLMSHGLLPPGVHDATLPEVGAAFGAANARRQELFEKLGTFIETAKRFAVFKALYVDGSFVTDKELPGDIDAVLELPRADLAKLVRHPDHRSVLDRPAAKAAYEIDLFIQPAPPPAPAPDMANFFQHLKPDEALLRRLPPGTLKGIVRVVL